MDKSQTVSQFMQQGRDRLDPSLTNPNWLVLRERSRIFRRWSAQLKSAELKVLDVGGRIQPYRPLIADRTRQYVALDLRSTLLVDVMARAEYLPFSEDQFDLVICTQMLEYVAEPSLVMAEIFRVLKPGGNLWLSVPSAAPDPGEELWRFLPSALRALLAAFRRVDILPEGGSVAGLFRTMNVCFEIFMRYPSTKLMYRYSLCPLINGMGALLEKASGGRNQQFAVNYSVLAQK
jgi:SAM-dependent methyltransferase